MSFVVDLGDETSEKLPNRLSLPEMEGIQQQFLLSFPLFKKILLCQDLVYLSLKVDADSLSRVKHTRQGHPQFRRILRKGIKKVREQGKKTALWRSLVADSKDISERGIPEKLDGFQKARFSGIVVSQKDIDPSKPFQRKILQSAKMPNVQFLDEFSHISILLTQSE